MGNNNSNQGNKTNVVNKHRTQPINEDGPNFLDEFYARDPQTQVHRATNGIYQEADRMYNCIWQDIGNESQLDVFSDPAKGIHLPYYSNQTIGSDYRKDYLLSSENPKYIEFIYCETPVNGANEKEINEKYRVHQFEPDHDCKENCHCIRQFIEISANTSRVRNVDNFDNKNIFSPASNSQPGRPGAQVFSPTSSEGTYQYNTKGSTRPTHTCPATQSGGMCPAMRGGMCSAMQGGTCGVMQGGTCGAMWGGADNDTSPETTTDSDEEFENAFSDTSEMSDTTTSPGNNYRGNYRGNYRDNIRTQLRNLRDKSKMNQDMDTSSDEAISDATSDMSTDMKKRKIATDDNVTSEMVDTSDQDEVDSIDEDLEGLEDEDIMEDGFLFEQSDVTSSDLYRMQSRIFGSETDTDYEYTENNFDNEYNSDDNDSTTDIVQNAYHKMNLRKKINNSNPNNMRNSIFDSEDRDIMEMGIGSSTDKYTKRTVKRNNKYR